MRNPERLAKALAWAYYQAFGGVERGKYAITLKELAQMFKVEEIEDRVMTLLEMDLYDRGILTINFGEEIGLISVEVIDNWRRLPKWLKEEIEDGLVDYEQEDLYDDEFEEISDDDEDDDDGEEDEEEDDGDEDKGLKKAFPGKRKGAYREDGDWVSQIRRRGAREMGEL